MVILGLLCINRVRSDEPPHPGDLLLYLIISVRFGRVKRKPADFGRCKSGKIVYKVKRDGDPHI